MKKGLKIGIADILIVAFFIGVFCGVYYFLNNRSKTQKSTEHSSVRVTLEVKKARDGLFEAITVGDEIYEKVNNIYLGKIVDKSITEAKEYTTDSINGIMKEEIVPQRYDITVTFEGPPSEYSKIGHELSAKGKGFMCNGYIIGLEEEIKNENN